MQDDNYPEVLQDLKDSLTATLIDSGINEETAINAAHRASETIRKNWGGMLVYICKGQEYELSKRDQAVWDEYNGRNRHYVCQKYGITEQWLYKIVKRQKQKFIKDRQSDLFSD